MWEKIKIYHDGKRLIYDFHKHCKTPKHWRWLIAIEGVPMEQASLYLAFSMEKARAVVEEELAAADAGG